VARAFRLMRRSEAGRPGTDGIIVEMGVTNTAPGHYVVMKPAGS
jgi:hypothetical protein